MVIPEDPPEVNLGSERDRVDKVNSQFRHVFCEHLAWEMTPEEFRGLTDLAEREGVWIVELARRAIRWYVAKEQR